MKRYSKEKNYFIINILYFQIEHDFNFIHPNKSCILLEKWDTFFSKSLSLFKTSIKDKLNLKILENISSITNKGKHN